MSSEFEFEFEGLEELEKDLTKAIKACPTKAEDTLKDIAKDFKKSAKKRANSELKPHERTGGDKNKAIKRKWVDENMGATALVYNSARHYHLIENGHNLVKGGQIIGFVPGKHIMEKTRNEYENIVPQRFEQMVDDILKGSDLD